MVCQFLELVRDYDPSSSIYFGHYIKVKLAWRMKNYRRRIRQRTRPETPLPAPEHAIAAAPDLIERVDVEIALQRLSARQRDVLIRSYWHDEDAAPIARALGISARAVRALRLRAERRLAALLGEKQGPP